MQKWRKFKKRLELLAFCNLCVSIIGLVGLTPLYAFFKLDFYHGDPFDFFFNYVFISVGLVIIFADRQINSTSHSYDHRSISSTSNFPSASDQRTDYVNNPTYSSMPGNNYYTSPFSNISSIGISKSPFDS